MAFYEKTRQEYESGARTARNFMRKFNIEFVLNTEDQRLSWTGKVFRAREFSGCDWCHELAHWLLCSENRRALPEFGLGPIPRMRERYGVFIKPAVTEKQSWLEDMRAIILSLSYMRALGLDADSYVNHYWTTRHKKFLYLCETHPHVFWSQLAWLQKKGFIDNEGKPIHGQEFLS